MMRLLSGILTSLLFLSGISVPVLPEEAAAPVTRMLLIGCDYFVTQPNTAPVSENNVLTVEAVWSDGSREAPETVRKVNATGNTDSLRSAVMEAFAESKDGDVNICYISTHGVLPEDGDPVGMTLLFSDGRQEVNVSPEELREMLDMAAGRKILILDACYSGAVIGKGAPGLGNIFDSPEYTVITSSGATEKSWFWSATADSGTGVGYFTGALSLCLNAADGYPADSDRDGKITQTELKKMLDSIHGVSVARIWPECSDSVVFEYDPEKEGDGTEQSAVIGLRFDNRVPDPSDPTCRFSFTVNRSARMIYRMIPENDGEWNFEDASFLFDDAEDGGAVGMLRPGHKERTLSPGIPENGNGGYVLLQVIGVAEGGPKLYGTHVICIPADADTVNGQSTGPVTEILIPEKVTAGTGTDFTVRFATPCAVTVAVVDENGKVISYPAVDRATRPEGIRPEGMFLHWDGCDRRGEPVSPGYYRIRVRVKDSCGEDSFEEFEVIER